MYGSTDEIQTLRKERDEVVALLAKVCEHVKDTIRGAEDTGLPLYYMDEIPGLVSWWTSRRPKMERDIKLEKVIRLIQDATHSENDKAEYLAARILDAIS